MIQQEPTTWRKFLKQADCVFGNRLLVTGHIDEVETTGVHADIDRTVGEFVDFNVLDGWHGSVTSIG